MKSVSWSFGSLVGGKAWQMVLTGGNQDYGHYIRSVSVGDVNGFTGSWMSTGSQQTLKLTAASGEQNLTTVYPNYQFPIDVVNGGTTAVVDYVRGTTGALAKEGVGTLRVRTVYDAPLQLQVNGGEVLIDGVIGDDDPVLAQAVMHLDASRVDTLQGYVDDKGRHRVTNWVNCAGVAAYDAKVWDNSKAATASHLKRIGTPFVAKNASGTGLSMMDFGAAWGTTSTPDDQIPITDEPTNCVMKFTRLTNIREVFVVLDYKGMQTNSGCPFLGDGTDYAFVGNQNDAFKNASSYPGVADGDVFYNNSGVKKPMGSDNRIDWAFDSYSPKFGDLTMLNLKAAADLHAQYLAADRMYKGTTGGIRIGELLIFTNVLTSVERRNVSEYLMKKWFGTYPQKEFKTVLTADGVALSVPEGKTAKVGTISARGKIVKRGGGILAVDHLYPADTEIVIEGGDVRFTSDRPAVDRSKPAGTPQFWYDADADNAFETDEEGVLRWHDCRSEYSTGRQASRMVEAGKTTDSPEVDTTSLPGHTVVSFPEGSAMGLPGSVGGSYAFQGEELLVFSFSTAQAAKNYNHIGAGDYKTDRNAYKFYDPKAADDKIGGEVFTINGVPVYPFEPDDGTTFEVGKWYVVSAAYSSGANIGRIASNSNRGRLGNIKIGEIITYSKSLTDEERRNTIAYLMKKWLNREIPDIEVETTPALTFAPNLPVTIESMTYRSVVGGNGSLTKTGAGEGTIEIPLSDAIGTLTVSEGSLSVSRVGYQDKSAFHFDALAPESITTFTTEDGQGGLLTNVSVWADVRANGVKAQKTSHNSYLNFTNPVLTKVEMRPGVWRPALDFLKCFGRSDDNKTGTYLPGAGLDISTEYKNIAEAHVVFCDTTTSSMPLFTARNEVQFNRGDGRHLFATASDTTGTKSASQVQEGYIRLDGQPAAPSTSLPAGYHLVSIVPTADVSVNTIGRERYINGGGSGQAELIGFTTAQSDAEREYLQSYLMYKWFGAAKPTWTNQTPIVELTVEKGATANFTSDIALMVSSLSGSGMIKAKEIADVAAIELPSEDGHPVVKAIDGNLGFADHVTLTLTGDLHRLRGGEYDLITVSGSIANFQPENWTVVSNIRSTRSLSVKCLDGKIVLVITDPGVMLIVR